MPMVIRRLSILLACAVITVASSALARSSKEEAAPVAAAALSWAIEGGLAQAKAIPDSATLDVASIQLPSGSELKVPGRTVEITSVLRLQALTDIKGELRPVFVFSSLRVKGRRATVSISLKWITPLRGGPTEPPVEGAMLELEQTAGEWKVTKVTEHWS